MKIYNLKETSQKINIPPSKLKQWEKDLAGLLAIPRTKQGARYYTDHEIEQLFEIKELYQQHKKKETIRSIIQSKLEPSIELVPQEKENTVSIMTSELPAAEQLNGQESFFAAMDSYKVTFLSEVKNEIRSVVQKEIVDEMKKEISKGMVHTAKSLADSIYKSGAHTLAEIADLKDAVGKVSERTEKGYHSITNIIENQALETSEEFFTLSKQLSETSDEIAHYTDNTKNGIESLTEIISKERESYAADLEQFRQEIRQREVAFQSLLTSFRETAPTKEKKWWHFW